VQVDDARVVDEQVQGAAAGQVLVGRPVHLCPAREVAEQDVGLAARSLGDPPLRGFALAWVAAEEDDFGAGAGQGLGDGAAVAVAGTRHETDTPRHVVGRHPHASRSIA
jgi:hypothetical protein